MENQKGFSLIEILITVVLLGFIAIMAMSPLQNKQAFYQDNVGEQLAEQTIEVCRNTAYDNLASSNTTTKFTTRGVSTDYDISVTVAGFDVANVTASNTYQLDNLLVAPAGTPQVTQVTVQVSVNGKLLAQRIAILHP